MNALRELYMIRARLSRGLRGFLSKILGGLLLTLYLAARTPLCTPRRHQIYAYVYIHLCSLVRVRAGLGI